MITPLTSVGARIESPGADQILYVLAKLNIGGYNGLVIEMSGPVDVLVLERAVRLAMEAEPILGCKFVPENKKPYWQRREDLDTARHCLVIHSSNPHEDARAQALRRYDPDADPALRVFVYRPAVGGDVLLWQVSHCVADGTATFQIVQLVASIYSGLLQDSNFQPPRRTAYDWKLPLYGGLDARGKLRLLSNAVKEIVTQTRQRNQTTIGFRGVEERESAATPVSPPAFVQLKMDGAECRALKTAAFANKCWINDLLTAAFLRAFTRLAPAQEGAMHRVVYMVDLRRHLPAGFAAPVCNLLGYHVVDLGLELGANFGATLKHVVTRNKALEDPAYTLRNMPLTGPMMKMTSLKAKTKLMRKNMASLSRKGAPPAFTFLGFLDHRSIALGAIEALDLHPASGANPLPNFAAEAVGFRDGLSISMSFYENGITRDSITGLFKQMRSELRDFVKG